MQTLTRYYVTMQIFPKNGLDVQTVSTVAIDAVDPHTARRKAIDEILRLGFFVFKVTNIEGD